MTPWKRRFLLETIVWDVMLNAGSLSGWKSIIICRAQLPSPCLKATESQVFYDCLRSFSQLWKNYKTSLSNENCWSSSVKHSKCFKNSGTEAFRTLGLKWNRWKSLGCQTFWGTKKHNHYVINITRTTSLELLSTSWKMSKIQLWSWLTGVHSATRRSLLGSDVVELSNGFQSPKSQVLQNFRWDEIEPQILGENGFAGILVGSHMYTKQKFTCIAILPCSIRVRKEPFHQPTKPSGRAFVCDWSFPIYFHLKVIFWTLW